MSTKIYTAYRLKRTEDFWPFLRDTRRKGVEEVRKVLTELYFSFMDQVDRESAEYKKHIEGGASEKDAKRWVVEKAILEGYRSQLGRSERNLFDFDVSIAVREHEGRLYLIPHCDMAMRRVLDFLKEDPRLEDFAYWNNTDMPDGMSTEEWDQRSKVWNAIDNVGSATQTKLYADGWSDYVAIEICTYAGFWKVSPFVELAFGKDALKG